MKSMSEKKEFFPLNPNLESLDFILVGSLGEELSEETKEFKEFLAEAFSKQQVTVWSD